MIVKEFLVQRLAPLQAHSRPLRDYRAGDEELRLWYEDLPTDELSRVAAILLGGDPGDLPEALGPLYRLENRADVIAGLPVFDERGLLPAVGSSHVEVSSGNTSHEGDLEKTIEDCLASAPLPSQVVLLRELADDAATGEVSAGVPSCPIHTSRGPASTPRATWDVVLAKARRKKSGVKPKATPDAPSGLFNVSLPADGEEEARKETSQVLIIAPPEPPKRPEAAVVTPLPEVQALDGHRPADAPMPATSR
ncbi:hypothetical protein D1007_15657 [Hordeum vulgare]|nr:hypothetical protein D1007_15657 [Hordeum vulgare]